MKDNILLKMKLSTEVVAYKIQGDEHGCKNWPNWFKTIEFVVYVSEGCIMNKFYSLVL